MKTSRCYYLYTIQENNIQEFFNFANVEFIPQGGKPSQGWAIVSEKMCFYPDPVKFHCVFA
jgi:hypothetical protein